jgi:hypothetical protein
MKRYQLHKDNTDLGTHLAGEPIKVAIMNAILSCMPPDDGALLHIEHHRGRFWHVYSSPVQGYHLIECTSINGTD